MIYLIFQFRKKLLGYADDTARVVAKHQEDAELYSSQAISAAEP